MDENKDTKRWKFVRAADAEHYDNTGGEKLSILATAVDTAGRVSIYDSKLPEGNAAPWHYHDIDDETFW